MPSKIITVTANSAIDQFIEISVLNLGEHQKAASNIEYPAGKGINVARTISTLNTKVFATGFVGIESAPFFNSLDNDYLSSQFIYPRGKTRTNLTLFEVAKQQETHIRTTGFSVTEHDCQGLITLLDKLLTPRDLLVLSGSLPPGAPEDFYATLIALAHQNLAIAILDSSGKALIQGVSACPHLIKPNLSEFEELAGQSFATEQAIVEFASTLMTQGIERIVISLGEQGAIFVTKNTRPVKAHIDALTGEIISSVGCGDALVGALAVSLTQQRSVTDTIKLAMACATANLFSKEPGCFDLSELIALESRINFEWL